MVGFFVRADKYLLAFWCENGFSRTTSFLLGAQETEEQVRRAVPTGQRHPQWNPHALRAWWLLPVHPLLDHWQRANQTIPQRYCEWHRKGWCHPVC